nr:hypothetical protein [uncultured Desulfobulbus sp.]
MFKYSLFLSFALLFVAVVGENSAVAPPKYLEIKNFKQCLTTQKFDTWEGWCMPALKPETCPAESWEQLNALDENDKVPPCPMVKN